MSLVSLLEQLHEWANVQPDKKAWSFLNDKGELVESYSYQELENAVNGLAEFLISPQSGLRKGDRALLVFFPGLDFTVSLLACFKAHIVAVPVFPPDPRKLKKDLHHFVSIQSSSGAKVALTNAQFNFVKKVEGIRNVFGSVRWPELQWVEVDEQLKKGKALRTVAAKDVVVFPSLDTIAFLQYTSGSTSEPKGVMISHHNLAHNLKLIKKELKADQSTVNVAWLPQYHDMGLIGSYMGVISCGGSGYYISPISFLKDPLVWIRCLSKYHATHSQAPNFAFALVARKFSEYHGPTLTLDLSSLRHMINAAEPVDYDAIMNFYDIFAQFGLPPHVVVPTYGLAEHTVFVCSGGRQVLTVPKAALEQRQIEILHEEELQFDEAHKKSARVVAASEQKIVGCGFPFRGEDVKLLIVDSKTNSILPELAVGEVWVDSPSKAMGYWGLTELSEHDFHAQPEGSGGDKNVEQKGSFLRTGDLGFMYKEELFICGRIKDLIIIGGSNHYPQDIEHSIELSVGEYLRAGCSAAFSLRSEANHTEDVAYVAEVKEGVKPVDYPNIVKKCRECAAQEHGVGLAVVCLLQTRSIPKTTSGKIARSWCKRGLLEGTLSIVHRSDKVIDAAYSEKLELEYPIADERNVPRSMEVTRADEQPKASAPAHHAHHTAEEIRAMSIEEIQTQLEKVLVQVSATGPSQLKAPVDKSLPLIALGLDSMTVVQFKGVIENRFYCDIPDEFIFSNLATLNELTFSVKNGSLTADQESRFESAGTADPTPGAQSGTPQAAVVVNQKQPLCPWFTCCY